MGQKTTDLAVKMQEFISTNYKNVGKAHPNMHTAHVQLARVNRHKTVNKRLCLQQRILCYITMISGFNKYRDISCIESVYR